MTLIPPRPGLPLPPSLRGLEYGTFTHSSIARRLPEIGRRTLNENVFSENIAAALGALIESIPDGPIVPLRDIAPPDAEEWVAYLRPHLGNTWLQVPWFFAENYFYRRILEAVGYFRPGPGYEVDPFEYQKDMGLETGIQAIQRIAQSGADEVGWARDSLVRLISMTLAGNRADLSLWPAGPGEEVGIEGESRLIVDDRLPAIDHLFEAPGGILRVDFIADNAGLEIVSDLTLADYFLRVGPVESVTFHLKAHPTFVSDAMIKDVSRAISTLSSAEDTASHALGQRLERFLEQDRLRLRSASFWTSPMPMWEMDMGVRTMLSLATLIICKGDANYRRLLGDRHWQPDDPFAEIVRYIPAPLLAVRSLKSEVAAGLSPGQAEDLSVQDSDWMINGRWGVIQFAKPGY